MESRAINVADLHIRLFRSSEMTSNDLTDSACPDD
jgi:hypothetical protein